MGAGEGTFSSLRHATTLILVARYYVTSQATLMAVNALYRKRNPAIDKERELSVLGHRYGIS